MKTKRPLALEFSIALLAAAGAQASHTAHAQQGIPPSQTPPGAEVEASRPRIEFDFSAPGTWNVPEGAEDLRFVWNSVEVEGGFDELTDETVALQQGKLGREASIAEVYVFSAELQRAYANAGFPLARVIVPPQEIGADGAVRLQVVDGFVEAIDASQLPARARSAVERYLRPLIGRRHLTERELARQVILSGRTAGVQMQSSLAAGQETGGARIVLTGEFAPLAGVAAIDNSVGDELGGAQATLGFALNSFTGHGDALTGVFSAAPDSDVFSDDAPRHYLAIGYSRPIGTNGLVASISVDYSRNRPGGALAAQALEGEYGRLGVSLSYPLILTRAQSLSVTAGIDAISDVQRTGFLGSDVTLSADRLRILRLALLGETRLLGGYLQGTGSVSQGLDALGARTREDADPLKPLTRQGADATFTALDVSFAYAHPVSFGANLNLFTSGRYDFNTPVVRSQQFAVTGPLGISGLLPGSILGDYGIVGRAEIDRPFSVDGLDALLTPYLFAAASATYLRAPTAVEREHTSAQAAGVGLKLDLAAPGDGKGVWQARVEWAQTQSNDERFDDSRVSASLVLRF